MCYKLACFLALLILSISLSAAQDQYLRILPSNTVKVGDMKYQITRYDFSESIKRIRKKVGKTDKIKDDILINEKMYKVHAFYNLKTTATWHKLYVIQDGKKIFVRISE